MRRLPSRYSICFFMIRRDAPVYKSIEVKEFPTCIQKTPMLTECPTTETIVFCIQTGPLFQVMWRIARQMRTGTTWVTYATRMLRCQRLVSLV